MLNRVILLLFLFLQGCVLGPNFCKPKPCVSDCWVSSCNSEDYTEPMCDWWKAFHDPLLERYIQQAACNNHDIAIAEANIIEARAYCQIAASSFFPKISADLAVAQFRFSPNSPFFAFDALSGLASGTPSLVQTLFNAIFDATWEIDLFGKTQRSVEQAKAKISASIDSKNDILISIFAEVAKTYLNIRGFQQQKMLSEKNIALLEEIQSITDDRVRSGLDNALDSHDIAAELANAKSTLPYLTANIYLGIYSLSVLTGQEPECLLEEMLPLQEMPKPPFRTDLGLRSDILKRRPDVRRAENELHAANAAIGIAYANFFPTFDLFGLFGFQSEVIKKLFDWSSRTYLYADNASFPIFQGGKLCGNLKASKAQALAAYERYQQVVLTALQDAQNSLTAYREEKMTNDQLQKSVMESTIVRDLSKDRYEKGLIDLKTFLDYERLLIGRELNLTSSETKVLIDLVSLYKALGGGWECAPICCSCQ